ncbi:hypothetical protein QM806_27860 [Rhodococcus sp. IEGM 1351]|nr:hypothetical protein [Rhodococcus sp. IEGM 1351]MDI9939204.1 hypothetical protein [Rhodococcus sp. IEGM 1351]
MVAPDAISATNTSSIPVIRDPVA